MSGLDDLIDHAAAAGARSKPRPGDVWCCDGHALSYRITPGESFYATLGPSVAICGITVTGNAAAGRPRCPGCLAELERIGPVLAQRLVWEGPRSRCGRYRIVKTRRADEADYPFMVKERVALGPRPRWERFDSSGWISREDAQAAAQEIELQRLCEGFRAAARGEPEPGSPAAEEDDALQMLSQGLTTAFYALGRLIAARREQKLPVRGLLPLRDLLASGRRFIARALKKGRRARPPKPC